MITHVLAVLLVTGIATAEDPCNKNGHMEIPSMGERFVNFKTEADEEQISDYALKTGWYYAGPDPMPETPPPDIFTCGTKFPIWLNDSHPKKYEVVSVVACKMSLLDYCDETIGIKILRCKAGVGEEDFFVYHLSRVSAPGTGYCFGTGKAGSSPKYIVPKPTVSAKLNTEYSPIGHRPITSTYFFCDFIESKDDKLFYVVIWYVNNDKFFRTEYGERKEEAAYWLTEDTMDLKDFKLGSNVSCSVRAFIEKDGVPGKSSKISDNFFAGIKVLSKRLRFSISDTDTSKRTIRVKSTIPIGCQGGDCKIGLVAYVPDDKCTGLAFKEGVCGVFLFNKNFSEEAAIQVTTNENGQYKKGGVFQVHLKTQQTPEKNIWGNYELPPISVEITVGSSTRIYEGKSCTSNNDPHMKTFDGMRYDNHQEGDYILYRNIKYDTEVQVRYYKCGQWSTGPIKCNCGVVVRAGGDIFEVNVCNGKSFIGYKRCGDDALVGTRDSLRKYKIYFPYGTYVETTVYGSHMSISVIPSSQDEGATVGLCGTLDGICTNDYHYRKDNQATIDSFGPHDCHTTFGNVNVEHATQPKTFIQQWRVREDENLFKRVPKYSRWSSLVCVCENTTVNAAKGSTKIENSIPCKENGVATCSSGKPIQTDACVKFSERKRRSMVREPIIPVVNTDGAIRIQKRDAKTANMNESEARQFCNDNIGVSTVYSLCSKVPSVDPASSIENCVVDIMLTGTTYWTSSTKEVMQDSCLSELRRNTTLRETAGNKTSIAEEIENMACPANCSDVGICVEGKCQCDDGFGGSDCSIDLSRGPSISGLLDNGLCDVVDMECDHAYVFGYIFTDSDNLTCKLEEFTVSQDGKRNNTNTFHVKAEFDTMIEAICPLHQVRRKRSIPDEEFVLGFTITVSNDGYLFEPGKELFIFNSRCQEVHNISNTLHFTLKGGYCYIDNLCVSDGAVNTKDNCLMCDVRTDSSSWTASLSRGCTNDSLPTTLSHTQTENGQKTPIEGKASSPGNYLWVIGVVLGVLAGLGIGIIIVIKLSTKRAKKVSDSTLLPNDTGNTKVSSKGK